MLCIGGAFLLIHATKYNDYQYLFIYYMTIWLLMVIGVSICWVIQETNCVYVSLYILYLIMFCLLTGYFRAKACVNVSPCAWVLPAQKGIRINQQRAYVHNYECLNLNILFRLVIKIILLKRTCSSAVHAYNYDSFSWSFFCCCYSLYAPCSVCSGERSLFCFWNGSDRKTWCHYNETCIQHVAYSVYARSCKWWLLTLILLCCPFAIVVTWLRKLNNVACICMRMLHFCPSQSVL